LIWDDQNTKMIFSKRDLENHFFVGTIETKNIYG